MAVNDLREITLASTAAKSAPQDAGAAAAEASRVHQNFPETLLWRPELITDDQGRARLDIELADLITTWRLTASAVSTQGQLGAAKAVIRVFQPFFVDLDLPVSLTRGDEVSVPAVVSNYLDRSQHVTLALLDAPGSSGWRVPKSPLSSSPVRFTQVTTASGPGRSAGTLFRSTPGVGRATWPTQCANPSRSFPTAGASSKLPAAACRAP